MEFAERLVELAVKALNAEWEVKWEREWGRKELEALRARNEELTRQLKEEKEWKEKVSEVKMEEMLREVMGPVPPQAATAATAAISMVSEETPAAVSAVSEITEEKAVTAPSRKKRVASGIRVEISKKEDPQGYKKAYAAAYAAQRKKAL